MRRPHLIALAVFLLLFGATWVNPPWPAEKALHDSLTVLAVAGLCWWQARRPLPLSSFMLVLGFLALHTIAARWIYSFVPYDSWTSALFGFRLSEVFGWQRNHFDRLLHFVYGLCLAGVLRRYLMDKGWQARRAGLVAVEVVISTSALYELLEWMIASFLAPDLAEAYNGQQGDIWDPHKDIALALLGAVVWVLVASLSRRGSAQST